MHSALAWSRRRLSLRKITVKCRTNKANKVTVEMDECGRATWSKSVQGGIRNASVMNRKTATVLMGSAALNAFHASLGEPVAGDALLPAEELAGILRGFDARHVGWEESSDWYFVSAEKPAS